MRTMVKKEEDEPGYRFIPDCRFISDSPPATKRKFKEEDPASGISHNAQEATMRKQLTDSIPEDVKNSHVMKYGIGELALFGATIEYIHTLEKDKEDLEQSNRASLNEIRALEKDGENLHKSNLKASLALKDRIRTLEEGKADLESRAKGEAADAWEMGREDLEQRLKATQDAYNAKGAEWHKVFDEVRGLKRKLKENKEKAKAARKALIGQ